MEIEEKPEHLESGYLTHPQPWMLQRTKRCRSRSLSEMGAPTLTPRKDY